MPPKPFDLEARHALVTGCGSAAGIGFATARMLSRLGARVSLTSTTERIRDRAAELGEDAFPFVADLTDRAQAFALVAAVRDAHGAIDLLVNAAGMVQTGFEAAEAPFAELSPAALDRQLEITLKTAFHVTQAVLPEMVERGHGRVVMVSSVTGPLVTAPGSAAYATSKGAMDALMRTIAIEHGRAGVTANSVAPGVDRDRVLGDRRSSCRPAHANRATGDARRGRCARRVPLLGRGELHNRPVDRGRRWQHHPGAARHRSVRRRVGSRWI